MRRGASSGPATQWIKPCTATPEPRSLAGLSAAGSSACPADALSRQRKPCASENLREGRGVSNYYGVRDSACPLSTRKGGGGAGRSSLRGCAPATSSSRRGSRPCTASRRRSFASTPRRRPPQVPLEPFPAATGSPWLSRVTGVGAAAGPARDALLAPALTSAAARCSAALASVGGRFPPRGAWVPASAPRLRVAYLSCSGFQGNTTTANFVRGSPPRNPPFGAARRRAVAPHIAHATRRAS